MKAALPKYFLPFFFFTKTLRRTKLKIRTGSPTRWMVSRVYTSWLIESLLDLTYNTSAREYSCKKKKNLLDPWFYLQRCGCEPHTRKTHVQMSPCGQRRTRDQAHPVCLRCILSFRRHCTNTLINTFKECINQQSHVSWHAQLFNCAC